MAEAEREIALALVFVGPTIESILLSTSNLSVLYSGIP